MLRNRFKRQAVYFFSWVLVASFFFNVQKSYAVYDGERTPIDYSDSSHMCSTGSFDFDPLSDNNDIEWQLDNPTCIAWVAAFGVLMVAAGQIVQRAMCVATNPNGMARQAAQQAGDPIPDIPAITPNVAYKIAYRTGQCTAFIADVAFYAPTLPEGLVPYGAAQSDMGRCCAGVFVYLAAVASAIAALAIIYAAAKGAYENGRVCGYDWNVWKEVDANGDYTGEPKGRWRLSKYPGSRQYCIEDIFIGHDDPVNTGSIIYNSCSYSSVDGVAADAVDIKNQYFREYLYGGKETEDNGSGACTNPTSWDDAHMLKNLGYTSRNQRYYMTGPGVASNYACQRFVLEAASDVTVSAAYDCCKSRSQNTICIENAPMAASFGALGTAQGSYDHTFCESGSRCTVKSIVFEPYFSQKESNFLCAKTYSVCPYNHLLGGGTETAVYKTDDSGAPTSDLKNFCQYQKHCVKVPVLPYIRISNLDGAYISAACRNLKGDSQNVYGYSAELLPINSHGFSAPLVQCFKESIENALLNRAGDTKCKDPDEVASNGICNSGYFYKKDQPLDSEASFFVKIQNALKAVIKMALTLSITFLGAMVLLGMSPLTKKQLMMYILKIGLVMYFALGTGWQFGFIDGILGGSNYISDIMMKLDYANGPPEDQDGCQFPRFNYSDTSELTKYDNPSYPPGREYLKIWDTLDCKLARALGFGPEVSVPNLIKMILAGLLTGGLGLIFLVGVFMFAFFMLSVVIRAIHIFLMASVAIVLLIYVSPITITLALFERTKGIFDGWWKQILGLALQPVILFAYLGVYISIFDHIVIGSATFKGDGRSVPKTVVCNSDSADTSIYCIFRIADLGTFSGLEVIGIGLPVLFSMNQAKLNTIIKSAFIMFIFAGFMDKISELAAHLVGGSQLKSNSISAMAMAKKTFGALSAVQNRALRGLKKHGGAAASGMASRVKERAFLQNFKGFSAKPSGPGAGADAAASSGGAKGSAPDSSAAKKPDVAADSKPATPMPVADSKAQSFSQASSRSEGDTQKQKDDKDAMLF